MNENPGTESIKQILKYIHEGDYAIPHFQRGFEWRPGMVCDLIQSIIQNYFTGLILLWELSQNQAENDQWDPVWGANLNGNPRYAILDGQQRISSLYYALYNPEQKFPNRKSYYVFYIDLVAALNHDYDNSIEYKFNKKYKNWEALYAEKDSWIEKGKIPLSILSKYHKTEPNKFFTDSLEFNDWSKEFIIKHKEKLNESIREFHVRDMLNNIIDYQFVYYPLSSDRDIPDICNIFARVNEKGMKLSTFDLLNAFLYPKGVNLRKELWDNLDNETLKQIDPNMSEYLLKLISLVKQNYCSSKYLYNLIPEEKTVRKDEEGHNYEVIIVKSGNEFIDLWNKSCKNAEKAREIIMNTGESDFGAIKPSFIPNTTMIPVLGALLWIYDQDINSSEFIEYMHRWYWSATISEDYSGSSDSVMAKDFRDWKLWVKNKKSIERIRKINNDFIEEIDFKFVRKGSARYNTILCLLALNKAPDFFNQREIGSGDYANSRINDHHIFPSKVNDLNLLNSKKFKETKDSIVNKTLLFDETNKKIMNKKPSEYLNDMISKHGDEQRVRNLLRKHFIDKSAYEAMEEDNYDDFIFYRENRLKKHLIGRIGLK